MTHSPAAARALEATAAARSQLGATTAAQSQRADTGAALSLCAAGPMVIGAPTAIAATVSVPRQWVRLRSAQQRRGPTTAAAAATTPTAAGFARAGIMGTERRDAVGLWCAKPMVKS